MPAKKTPGKIARHRPRRIPAATSARPARGRAGARDLRRRHQGHSPSAARQAAQGRRTLAVGDPRAPAHRAMGHSGIFARRRPPIARMAGRLLASNARAAGRKGLGQKCPRFSPGLEGNVQSCQGSVHRSSRQNPARQTGRPSCAKRCWLPITMPTISANWCLSAACSEPGNKARTADVRRLPVPIPWLPILVANGETPFQPFAGVVRLARVGWLSDPFAATDTVLQSVSFEVSATKWLIIKRGPP